MTNKSKQKPKPKGMSMFFKRISQAVFKFGGWMTPKKTCSLYQKQFVVFEGEYAGTWTFSRGNGKLQYAYECKFSLEDKTSSGKNWGLDIWKAQLLEVYLRYAHAIQKLDWSTPPKTVGKQIVKKLSCLIEDCQDPYCQGIIFKEVQSLHTEFGEEAIIFAARAGYDPVSLLRELNKNPGRVESIKQALAMDKLLASHKDRISFSKKFFQTWSVRKSLPAWVKRPQRWKSIVKMIEEGFFLHQLDVFKLMPKNWTGIPGMTEEGVVRLTRGFLERIMGHTLLNDVFGFQFNSLGIQEKREFIKNMVNPREVYAYNQEVCQLLDLFWDALTMWSRIAPEYYPVVDEHREWIPRLQQAIQGYKPYVFIDMHNRISTAVNIVDQDANKDKIQKALAYHKSCEIPLKNTERCSCPAEFKPLTTAEEFNKEGNELRHCIAYYFLSPNGGYCMAMKNKKSGERSSVMVKFPIKENHNHFSYRIVQHYGHSNSVPSEEDQEILKQHLEYCCLGPINRFLSEIPEPDGSTPF